MCEGVSEVMRTHTCGELRKEHVGKKVKLAGWVHAIRSFGKKAFVDLRDRYGITQVVFEGELAEKVGGLSRESVVLVEGEVRKRLKPNPELSTGEIEVIAEKFEILSRAEPLPYDPFAKDVETTEETRLRYRYLDLRRKEMQNVLIFRSRAMFLARKFLLEQGFIEVETPYLSKPTPEGARDFLVPSRTFRGKFWALTQSPQIYKQLLMVAGIDKYFQFARCFRDEDLRKDRQYEFTQLDYEMSFVDEQDVQEIAEKVVVLLYSELLGKKIKLPLPRISWKEAIERFGSDKPDLRFGLELKDITELMRGCGFRIFEEIIAKGGVVKALLVPKLLSRKEVKEFERIAKENGFPGVAWLKIGAGVEGGIANKLKQEVREELKELGEGTLLMLAGDWLKVSETLGKMRNFAGSLLGLRKGLSMLWVVDFPLLEWSEEEQRIKAMHHPFTAPKEEDLKLFFEAESREELLKIRARAYDLVINGVEVGGGSIRITDRSVQERMFEILGLSRQEAWRKFRMLLEAFKYGVPPHGGLAFGFDRLLQVMLEKESIREVIAFPKSKSGKALMEDAPSEADEEQLKELGIKIIED